MDDSFDVHSYEGLNNLLEDIHNFLDGDVFLVFFEVAEKIALLTVLHEDLEFFLAIVRELVDMDEIGVLDFPHDINLFESIFNFKGIDLDLFEGILFALLVGDEVDCAEAALPQYLNGLIFIHFILVCYIQTNFLLYFLFFFTFVFSSVPNIPPLPQPLPPSSIIIMLR